MNQVSEPDCTGGVGAHCPHELKSLVVWLEHLRPVVFQESDDPSFQLGPTMHAINWASSLDFLPHVQKLTCDISGLGPENFTVSPAFHYEDGRRVAWPSVGIFAKEGVLITADMFCDLDAALVSFCRGVLEGQEIVGQEQFFPVPISEKTAAIVTSLASDFLASFGGKKVGEARLLKTRNCEILVAGTYRPKRDLPLPDPERWTVTGEIDGLRGMTRTVFLNIGERKSIAILFDEATFKNPLRQRVLDGSMYDFVIETEWISHDKKVDSLVSFHSFGGDQTLV